MLVSVTRTLLTKTSAKIAILIHLPGVSVFCFVAGYSELACLLTGRLQSVFYAFVRVHVAVVIGGDDGGGGEARVKSFPVQ